MSVPVIFRISTVNDEERPERKLLLFPRITGKEVTESSESAVKHIHTTVRPTVSMAIVPSMGTVAEYLFAGNEAGYQPIQYLGSFRDHSQCYCFIIYQ